MPMPLTPQKISRKQPTVTLAIDIGGSGIKGILLNQKGQPIGERKRITTPQPSTPKAVFSAITVLIKGMEKFDQVSVGFPGVIQLGRVKTAPNLDQSWPGINLVGKLVGQLKKPVRAANDADVQGFGAIKGKGVELVITLGTGFGTALFINGALVPNLEIAHHPFRKGHTYEQELGVATLKKIGKKKWNQCLAQAIKTLDRVINYDHLYLGGGNGKKVSIKLPSNVTIVSNVAGLLGGIALWKDGQEKTALAAGRAKPAKAKWSRTASQAKAKKPQAR
jgi:polyphosphate glucokinase